LSQRFARVSDTKENNMIEVILFIMNAKNYNKKYKF
jgi:hypothetical protein